MATVLAQVIVSGIMLLGIFVQKKDNVLKGLRLFVKIPLEYVQGICKIGIPTALQGMAYCFISMILTRMVAGFFGRRRLLRSVWAVRLNQSHGIRQMDLAQL